MLCLCDTRDSYQGRSVRGTLSQSNNVCQRSFCHKYLPRNPDTYAGAFRFGGEYRSCRIVKSGSRWWICGDPLGATTSKQETRPQTERHPTYAANLTKRYRCCMFVASVTVRLPFFELVQEVSHMANRHLLLVHCAHSASRASWLTGPIAQDDDRVQSAKLFHRHC